MNRRAFIALLTAPMIVRATSLDALPRGAPLYGNPHVDGFQSIGGVNNHIRLIRASVGDYTVNFDPPPNRGDMVVMLFDGRKATVIAP